MNKPRRNAQRRKPAPEPAMSSLGRAYALGLASGLILALLVYLFTLPNTPGNEAGQTVAKTENTQVPADPAETDYIFYDHLAKQPAATKLPSNSPRKTNQETVAADDNLHYLLQAGSFRQAEDADRRRAELLLLGLNASVEPFTGNSGRLYRVYVGPFDTRAELSKARRLATTSQIETLVLKRPRS